MKPFTYMLLVSEGRMGEVWKPSRKMMLSLLPQQIVSHSPHDFHFLLFFCSKFFMLSLSPPTFPLYAIVGVDEISVYTYRKLTQSSLHQSI
jgi:hypothetical protein